jgi:hypothetical protein
MQLVSSGCPDETQLQTFVLNMMYTTYFDDPSICASSLLLVCGPISIIYTRDCEKAAVVGSIIVVCFLRNIDDKSGNRNTRVRRIWFEALRYIPILWIKHVPHVYVCVDALAYS